ncbi:hypothetical protein GW17_00019051 [Ensete ventricosum]|nr:hypothetical protein GW17_00019051 [Ensete ventricosum]RZS28134.1 hypothetical protein BHM03_00061694 [Ensete ventricosum]
MTEPIELQPDDGPRSSLGIGPSSDDAVGPHRKVARRFIEGTRKLARNMSGDRQKKIGRLTVRMLEATRLAGRIEDWMEIQLAPILIRRDPILMGSLIKAQLEPKEIIG